MWNALIDVKTDFLTSISQLRSGWPQVRIGRVATAATVGAISVLVIETRLINLSYGLAASLAAFLLVSLLLVVSTWSLILEWLAPAVAAVANPPLFLQQNWLRFALFVACLGAGVWFGSEHW
jgi:hypothetical protein